MKRGRALTALLLTLPLGLALPPAQALAEPGMAISNHRISPAKPTLHGDKPTRVTARVWATGVQVMNLETVSPTGETRKYPAARIGGSGSTDIWEGAYDLDRNQPTGRWVVRMNGWDGGTSIIRKEVSVNVRRNTRMSGFNGRPEKVLFGKKLLLKGTLSRLDPFAVHTASYVPFTGQKVKVYFSRQGRYSRAYRYKTSLTTDQNGVFEKWIKPRESGHWKIRFPGDVNYGPSSSRQDYISIRWK